MVKRKKKGSGTQLQFVMHDQCRLTQAKQEIYLKWLSDNPRYHIDAEGNYDKPTANEIVKECHKKSSPLYGFMELDTQKAAQKHWYEEAQKILRHTEVVHIDVVTYQEVGSRVPAYLVIGRVQGGHIPEENYIPAQRVADNPSVRYTVVKRAHADLVAWLDRYERHAKFLDVFSPVIVAARQTIAQLEGGPGAKKSKAG